MVFTYLIGGKAGYGVKKAGLTGARIFSGKGLHVFEMDDYPSVIRGSHNFSVVSCDDKEITSHYSKADLVVALDKRSIDAHRGDLAAGGVMVYDSKIADPGELQGGDGAEMIGVPMSEFAKGTKMPDLIVGVSGAAVLCCAIGIAKEEFKSIIEKEYHSNVEENWTFAEKIYDNVSERLSGRFKLEMENADAGQKLFTGNSAIGLGLAAAGLDIYIAYPMTPSTSILHYFAGKADDLAIEVVQPESEIAVANMALGAAFTGAKVACGTSGGGFCLMQEAFSLAGISESPVVFVVVARPGPATGVPTYTSQGDLKWIRHPGHGEFPRIVAVPGSVEECFYLASELMWLSWNFQTPTVLLSDKHLSESTKTVKLDADKAMWAKEISHDHSEGYKRYAIREDGISPLHFPPSKEMIKWTSYEHDERGITTEDPVQVTAMIDKRSRKGKNMVAHLKHSKTVNRFGRPDKSEKVIVTYGSTTMSVLEAVKKAGLDVQVVQPIYVEPFPVWEFEELKGKELIVVEMSEMEQFADLFRSRGFNVKKVIKKYDGRPFCPIDLGKDLSDALKEVLQ